MFQAATKSCSNFAFASWTTLPCLWCGRCRSPAPNSACPKCWRGGQPVSKADLSEQALGRPFPRFDRSIDVHVSSIGHKLGTSATAADGRSIIQTVIRKG